MTATTHSDLTAAEHRLLVGEVNEALRQDCPDVLQRSRFVPKGNLTDLDQHLEELVPIVRRTSATRIEPYLAQILDDICTKCPYQQPSAYCPLRHDGNCLLYRCAGPIVAAVRRALCEIDIGRGLASGKEKPCGANPLYRTFKGW